MGILHSNVLVFLLLILWRSAAASKRIECELLDEEEEPTVQIPVQGPPGKGGPPGPKGDRGIQGRPGTPDMAQVERLEREIAENKQSTYSQLEELERTIRDMQSNYVSRELLETCDFFHEGKCYALLMTTSRMNINEGKASCSRINGTLANVYDEVQFEKMRAVMRSRIFIGHHYNHIWTGMTIDVQQRRIRLSDGSWAPWVKWYPNRPYPTALKHVGIHVDADPNSNRHGMFDNRASYRLLGAWCEI